MIAAIRIRGVHDIRGDVERNLDNLRLLRKHACVLLEDTPAVRGQLAKVKDFATWGIINDDTKKILVEKRGNEYSGRLTDSRGKISYPVLKIGGRALRPYFNLSPPKGGFERKGIKVAFRAGGVLGDRGEHINELIRKMV
ncbi:MAG TPA: uL30 family ribosomal protein [Candidatus Nanoarchaeia archaeon]|nr:uL30 family ribosomal protein [Candidatus Nanoarchaeia archaeon]